MLWVGGFMALLWRPFVVQTTMLTAQTEQFRGAVCFSTGLEVSKHSSPFSVPLASQSCHLLGPCYWGPVTGAELLSSPLMTSISGQLEVRRQAERD